MNDADVAVFLDRFRRFGAQASVETYLALFHPDARLFDDGMERPIGVAEIPDHIRGVLALVKGFRFQVERWRARDDVVFVEAHNAGEIAGTGVGWRSVYRIELAGSQVIDGRRYFDRGPLVAHLAQGAAAIGAASPPPAAIVPDALASPARAAIAIGAAAVAPQSLPPDAFVAELARIWRERCFDALVALFREDASLTAPGLARPLARDEIAVHAARLVERLGGATLVPRRFAGDDSLLFVEWRPEARPGTDRPSAPAARDLAPASAPPPPGIVDRFDLVGGRVLAARSYFDAGAIDRFGAAHASH